MRKWEGEAGRGSEAVLGIKSHNSPVSELLP